MKILITGVAGFIGFSLAKKLCENSKNLVFGIDSLNKYYSIKLKNKRLNILNKKKNFFFYKINIAENNKLNIFFKNNKKFDYIFHFAAQAGVRYSYNDPAEYVSSNIHGFLNLLENLIRIKPKKIFYASSSSVYGDVKKFPVNENNRLSPKNIYGVSKKLNEKIASFYERTHRLKLVGLRFFTVYGPWGRPDMFCFKLFKAMVENKIFYLFNYGNHERDFTYIDDVILILEKLLLKKKLSHNIYNICSSNPVNIKKIIRKFKIKIKYKPLNFYETLKTHGDNKRIVDEIENHSFTKIDIGIIKTLEWYKKYKINSIT